SSRLMATSIANEGAALGLINSPFGRCCELTPTTVVRTEFLQVHRFRTFPSRYRIPPTIAHQRKVAGTWANSTVPSGPDGVQHRIGYCECQSRRLSLSRSLQLLRKTHIVETSCFPS